MRRAFRNTKANASAKHVKDCQRGLTQERYLLFRRATRCDEKPCYASFFQSMPTER